jgi:hypothetical protein
LIVDDVGDLVLFSEAIERSVNVDGQMAGVPGVGEPNGQDDREGDQHSKEVVKRGEEWRDEGLDSAFDDVPIEGWPRVETQTRVGSADRREEHVVGGNPGNPRESGESSDNVVGEPEIDELTKSREPPQTEKKRRKNSYHAAECVQEETHLTDLPSIDNSALVSVEAVVEGNGRLSEQPS